MRRVLLLLALAASPAHPLAAQALRHVDVRRALEPEGLLRVWNLAGAIRVVGWDRDSIAVTGSVPADREFFCGGLPRGMKCGVDVPMKEEGKAPGAYLEVRVPRRCQLWLKSGSGDLSVSDFDGDLDAYSVTGQIRVSGHARVVRAESMAGDIDLVGSAGTLRARTAGGGISLRVESSDVDASSVSGDLVVLDSRIRQGRFETVDGALRWEGPLPPSASLDFISHSGNVELVLPEDLSASFVIATYEGSVRNDFGTTKLVTARDLNGRELRFSKGEAEARVSIRTFKGKVALVRR